jgi:hypothetical protein
MNLKSIHIIRLLLLIVFSIFISCNEELYDIKDKHSFEDKNKISLTQFKKETSINKVDPMLNLSAETAFEENEIAPTPDFIIDTLAIKRYISADNKTSYTFRIYPLSSLAEPLDIYNLVYRKVGNSWETSIFYLKKLPKENSEHKLFEKIEKISLANVSYTVASEFGTCSYETINYHCTDPGKCDGSGECDLCSYCVSRYVTYTSCESGGSAGGGLSDPGSIPGGGGLSDPYAYSPNMFDNPVFDDPDYVNAVKAQTFFRQLANIAGAQQWANENVDAYNQIIQYQIDNKWSSASASFANELISLSQNETSQDSYNLLKMSLIFDKYKGNFENENFLSEMDWYMDLDLANYKAINPTDPIWVHFTLQCAVLKSKHPTWSNAKVYWEASRDLIHMALDVFGLVPVVGEVADLTNGALYTIEGDGVNATLSFASAVPVAGWAAVGVKYAVKIKTVATIGTRVELTWKVLADGTIYFGSNNTCRAQLRKVLGLAVGNLNQAHHIIPLNLQSNPIVQKAAKSADAFHLNEALNGIPLSTAVHSGSHGNYDARIFQKLKLFEEANPNATPSQCYNKVNEIISQIRTAIANNPNTPINQLNF